MIKAGYKVVPIVSEETFDQDTVTRYFTKPYYVVEVDTDEDELIVKDDEGLNFYVFDDDNYWFKLYDEAPVIERTCKFELTLHCPTIYGTEAEIETVINRIRVDNIIAQINVGSKTIPVIVRKTEVTSEP